MRKQSVTIPDEVVMRRIHVIRGHKVMLDRDLALLYGVQTRVLKQVVRRNMDRFPEDFMFELSKEETSALTSQTVTLKRGEHSKYPPFAFSEHGVLMLSSVLNSATAIAVNIQIIRVFTRMREMLLTHKDLLLELERIRTKTGEHDRKFQVIFRYLKQMEKRETERVLLAEVAKSKPRAPVGFKVPKRRK
jgi:phage regulator Rha-like protein